jgi:hypothetical protein
LPVPGLQPGLSNRHEGNISLGLTW